MGKLKEAKTAKMPLIGRVFAGCDIPQLGNQADYTPQKLMEGTTEAICWRLQELTDERIIILAVLF